MLIAQENQVSKYSMRSYLMSKISWKKIEFYESKYFDIPSNITQIFIYFVLSTCNVCERMSGCISMSLCQSHWCRFSLTVMRLVHSHVLPDHCVFVQNSGKTLSLMVFTPSEEKNNKITQNTFSPRESNEWYAKVQTHTYGTSKIIIARGKYVHLKGNLFHCYHCALCVHVVSLPHVLLWLMDIEMCPLCAELHA